jgi:predicted permease
MVRTFAALERAEPGFDDDSLLTFNLGISSVRYPEATDEAAFLESLLERIRAMPGVSAAGSSSLLPLTPGDFLDGFRREGYDDGFPDYPSARLHNVSSGFLETLGLPLVAGRTLTAADDAGAQRVVVVNETFARRWFLEGALGRRIDLQGELREIVGVVADKRHHGLREDPEADLWVPRAQIANPRLLAWVAVRTAGDPLALVPGIRDALTELDPTIAIDDPRTMSDRLDAALAPERFRAWVVGALASLATLLAVLGIYGLLSYSVARQRREIGIRIALGRTPGGMVGTTVARAVATTAVGVAIGLGIALAAGRFVAAFVPEVGPRDPLTLVVVPAVLLGAAALAALGPARRASRVDPAVALRAD